MIKNLFSALFRKAIKDKHKDKLKNSSSEYQKAKKNIQEKKDSASFFELFNQHADYTYTAMVELRALLTRFDNLEQRAKNIVIIEKNGDHIMHLIMKKLHKNFNTPIDREEIHRLISAMDDMLDLTEDISELINLYDIRVMTPEACQLSDICVICAARVKRAVSLLSDMRNADELLNIVHEIDQLESDGDRLMRIAMAKLFREESDIKNLIKMKAVYEFLETITDKADDVANIIQGLVIENA
jgi:uncharacterized protein